MQSNSTQLSQHLFVRCSGLSGGEDEAGPDDGEADPAAAMHKDPRKELSAMKAQTGGLKLAAKLLCPWLRKHASMYCAATKSVWTWYTHQVKHVKTPADGLAYAISSENGKWQTNLGDLLKILTDAKLLAEAGLNPFGSVSDAYDGDDVKESGTLCEFVLRLVGNRCFSSMIHDCPPHCYASVLSKNAEARRVGMDRMKRHWGYVTSMENVAARNHSAATIVDDLGELFPASVRLMFLLFERDQWSAASGPGRAALETMLCGLPDTKCVEDTHQHLRDLQRRSRTLVSSKVARTRACYLSPVLDGRGIPHRTVDKDTYVRRFRAKRTSVKKPDEMHYARRHILSQKWSSIMDTKDWLSTTPEGSRKSLAAWDWFCSWFFHCRQKQHSQVFMMNLTSSVLYPNFVKLSTSHTICV